MQNKNQQKRNENYEEKEIHRCSSILRSILCIQLEFRYLILIYVKHILSHLKEQQTVRTTTTKRTHRHLKYAFKKTKKKTMRKR